MKIILFLISTFVSVLSLSQTKEEIYKPQSIDGLEILYTQESKRLSDSLYLLWLNDDYQSLDELLNSMLANHGNPKVKYKKVAMKPHYNPITNTIVLYNLEDLKNFPNLVALNKADEFIGELAHAEQFKNSDKEIKLYFGVLWDLTRYMFSYNDCYEDPSCFEYEAHIIIENKLEQEFIKKVFEYCPE